VCETNQFLTRRRNEGFAGTKRQISVLGVATARSRDEVLGKSEEGSWWEKIASPMKDFTDEE
jgi:hypothetical protein